MKFVAGDLLDLTIKPLDLGEPYYEERLKNRCSTSDCGSKTCDTTETVPGIELD